MRSAIGTLIIVIGIVGASINLAILILCFYAGRLYRVHWPTAYQYMLEYWYVILLPLLNIIPGIHLIVSEEKK